MNYQEFEASFMKQNRKLKIALVAVLVMTSGTILLAITQKRYFLYRGSSIFEERPLAEEVCRQSFTSLVEGEPHPFVVSDEIIKLVKAEPFQVVVDKILMIKSSMENHCKIVLKSQGKLMAFDVTLEGNTKNPFFYRLVQLDEISAEKEEK